MDLLYLLLVILLVTRAFGELAVRIKQPALVGELIGGVGQGERTWQRLRAEVCKPFTKAEARSFPPTELAEATRWIGYTPENAPVR